MIDENDKDSGRPLIEILWNDCLKGDDDPTEEKITFKNLSTDQAGKIRILVEISMENFSSASFWQRVVPTAPFNTWQKWYNWMNFPKGSGTVTLKKCPLIYLSQSGIVTYPDTCLGLLKTW